LRQCLLDQRPEAVGGIKPSLIRDCIAGRIQHDKRRRLIHPICIDQRYSGFGTPFVAFEHNLRTELSGQPINDGAHLFAGASGAAVELDKARFSDAGC
jgi:hypothetical protein